MVINHNLTAMNANRQFNIVIGRQSKHMEKLSSGFRINRAADDAAGLAISEKMRRQIRGLSQGIENTQDGVSLCQIADGALNEVHDMLQRLEELSVKAANGTNTESDREAIQKEVDQILSEIDRISETSTFNEQRIFSDGTASATGAAQTQAYSAAQEAASKSIAAIQAYSAAQEAAKSAIQAYSAELEMVESNAIQTDGVMAAANTGFTVSGGTEGQDYTYKDGVLTIISSKSLTIHNADPKTAITDRIVVTGDANIILAGVNIDVSSKGGAAFDIQGTGKVNITLADGTENTLKSGSGCAGLQKNNEQGTLIINGNTGLLTAKGGVNGAGIGGGSERDGSNITITGGRIIAKGGDCGAGIGGGKGVTTTPVKGSGKNITIEGGIVEATGGGQAAGIGGGKDGNGINIVIRGGTITATGGVGGTEVGSGGAGIGGGSGGTVGGDSNSVIIEGGTVTATGAGYGAGIGGGRAGNSNKVTITGGTVKATGGKNGGAGVGSGGNSQWGTPVNDEITISDSIVHATGGGGAEDIGAGTGGKSQSDPEIENSLVIEGDKGTVYGDVTVDDDFTIDENVELEIGEDDSLTVGKNAKLTNNGTINNGGTMDIYGELAGNGSINGNPPSYYRDTGTGGSKRWWIQCGSEAGVGMFIEIESIDAITLGINSMDVTTQESADKAISMISGALEKSIVRKEQDRRTAEPVGTHHSQ